MTHLKCPSIARRFPHLGRRVLAAVVATVVALVCLGAVHQAAAASETSHPRLLFGADDLPAIRERASRGINARAAERMMGRADEFLKISTEPYKFDGAIAGRVLAVQVLELAMAGYLSQDPRYLEKAATLLEACADQASVDDFVGFNGALAVADGANALAMGYDWVAPVLSREQKEKLRREIREFGTWLIEHSATDFWGSTEPARMGHNWNGVTHGALGLCGLVLEEQAWIDRATVRARGYLQNAFDGTGAAWEGQHYMGYGFNSFMPFIQALKRSGGPDLLGEAKGLDLVPEFVLHSVLPWGGGGVAINQSEGDPTPSGWLHVLLDRFDHRVGLWGWLRYYGDPEEHGGTGTWGGTDHLGHNVVLPYVVLWADPDLEPQHPAEAGMPLTRRFRLGWVFSRSGWDDLDTLVSFTCGDGLKGIWNHADTGAFTFYARGEAFAVDLGPHLKPSQVHNTLLVDGEGQDTKGHSEPSAGRVLKVEERDGWTYIKGDLSPAYRQRLNPRLMQRELLMSRRPDRPYLLVVDRIRSSDGPHDFTWLIFTDAENTLELGDEASQARILGGRRGATCHVQAIWPEQTAIAIQPTLEGPHGAPANSFAGSASGEEVCIVTLLTAVDDGEAPPEVSREGNAGRMTITLTFADGTQDVLDLTPANIRARHEEAARAGE